MDQSIEYVKMCNCPEIQEAEHLESHNFYYHGFLADDKMRDVWLPRQDQLQEMVNQNINETIALNGFGAIFKSRGFSPINKHFNWDQLWLTFIMLELYGKKWNGEEWIK